MEFSHGELKLMFQRIDEKLDDIKREMSREHGRYDAEIGELRKKVQQHDSLIVRILAIGGTIWSAATLLAGFIIQKIFHL